MTNSTNKPHNWKDMTGEKSGRLTVVALHPIKNNNGRTMWACECECGGWAIVATSALTSKRTQSCGCLNKEVVAARAKRMALPGTTSSLNSLINNYKRGAAKRGYKWELTREEVKTITSSNCAYCGCEPSQSHKTGNSREALVYNGIDRVDNAEGYTTENAVACCGMCNKIKLNHDLEDLKAHMRKMLAHMEG